jgi:putative transport protein
MKLNPAILMGAIAGARSHGAPARAAACELGSSVPWIGFPVAYAVSTLAVTVMGYVAMAATR